jgi:uroporphyrinogen-III synthase
MALAIYIKDLQEMIIEELKSKDIEVKEIHCYKIAKKLYLFNIICIDRRLGELKLHKSAIKHYS